MAAVGSDNDDSGQDGDHDDDVRPSSSCSYHPSSSSADPPTPSLPGVAGVGGERAARGGGGNNQDDVAVLRRWRLDIDSANAHGADTMVGGVAIYKLIPSLIYC